ncbi:LysE/ArgO family amino acid transporter [Demequina lignilytica]|uniref:LysE/ArgO family amino acid transporter n=1 Tax=Demequina lignilytica TaxID=3051663 RepID=A0AB35MG84_9MICO|nr:LysE/ArgO family amino acid transporter [Demequina sp. SYSU T0a273]MDN4482768.1 LysE/ArgO family amino acid transporter [Demequina sp. SYSU T0a273]
MTFLAGLGLGLSLIVAIGAQNVFVLRQGLRREHVGAVVLICAVSDALLIALGVSGMGAAIASRPWLETGARWAGAAFLLGYALLAARRAWKGGETLHPDDAGGAAAGHAGTGGRTVATGAGLRAVAATALALTWLNPHVYLDTVLLLGSVAGSYGEARWIFAAGAVTGSVVWFTGLGYGARLLSGVLDRPGAWRILDGLIATVMLVLAVSLAWGA